MRAAHVSIARVREANTSGLQRRYPTRVFDAEFGFLSHTAQLVFESESVLLFQCGDKTDMLTLHTAMTNQPLSKVLASGLAIAIGS